MSLNYATDTNLARQIKKIASRVTSSNSLMTSSQKSILFMSALAAAGNIQHKGLRLATVKWVQSRSAKISASPEIADLEG
jgi:hypothetical protein